MRMSRLEKLLVNRRTKGMSNVDVVRRQLAAVGSRRGGQAVELGCGCGDVAAYLSRERGYNVVGMDVDPDQVALARRRHGEDGRLRFSVTDACELELEPASVDLAVAQNVFHHVPRWRPVVAELARLLKPDGHLLWLDLTPFPVIAALLRPLSGRLGVYTLDELRATFRDARFVEVAAEAGWMRLRHALILRKA